MSLKILLDCDGILANFATPYLGIIEKITGTKYDENQIVENDILKSLGLLHLKGAVDSVLFSEGYCINIPVYEGAKDAFSRLSKLGEIFIVTSPLGGSKYWMYERLTWLRFHFDLPKKNLIFASKKELIRGDIFVDDTPEMCVNWKKENIGATALLWDRPWNKSFYTKFTKVERIDNWEHVFEAIRAHLYPTFCEP